VGVGIASNNKAVPYKINIFFRMNVQTLKTYIIFSISDFGIRLVVKPFLSVEEQGQNFVKVGFLKIQL
jgi:hypothetical protein